MESEHQKKGIRWAIEDLLVWAIMWLILTGKRNPNWFAKKTQLQGAIIDIKTKWDINKEPSDFGKVEFFSWKNEY